MKATSGLVLIVFVGLVSCFNPPDYPSVPEIELEQIAFVETPALEDADTLNLSIHFTDGDGDIGLLADTNTDDPNFSDRFFFKVNENTRYVLRNGGSTLDIANDPAFIKYKTKRTNPNYDTLPNFNCLNWEEVTKTVNNNRTVVDTVYFQINQNSYNIFIDFLKLKNDGSGDFEEYDFRKVSCTTYDGRIPVLAKEAGQAAPLQGSIHYSMISVGFKLTFSNTPLKLRIQIQDRALNKSNIITSDPFTLSSITK